MDPLEGHRRCPGERPHRMRQAGMRLPVPCRRGSGKITRDRAPVSPSGLTSRTLRTSRTDDDVNGTGGGAVTGRIGMGRPEACNGRGPWSRDTARGRSSRPVIIPDPPTRGSTQLRGHPVEDAARRRRHSSGLCETDGHTGPGATVAIVGSRTGNRTWGLLRSRVVRLPWEGRTRERGPTLQVGPRSVASRAGSTCRRWSRPPRHDGSPRNPCGLRRASRMPRRSRRSRRCRPSAGHGTCQLGPRRPQTCLPWGPPSRSVAEQHPANHGRCPAAG